MQRPNASGFTDFYRETHRFGEPEPIPFLSILTTEEWKELLVPRVGIEPTLLSEPDFESGASTNFTTEARIYIIHGHPHVLSTLVMIPV